MKRFLTLSLFGLIGSSSMMFAGGMNAISENENFLDEEIITWPETLMPQVYTFITETQYGDRYAFEVNVGIDDNDFMYIQGLYPDFPEGVFKAKIDGNIAEVSQNQFLGNYGSREVYTKCLVDNPDYDWDDWQSPLYILAPEDVTYKLSIDSGRNVIASEDEGIYFCFNTSLDSFKSLKVWTDIELHKHVTYAGTPSNPYEPYFSEDYFEYYGFNIFSFVLSNLSTDENLLDTESLYYSIFLDGEPIVFEEDLAVDPYGDYFIVYDGISSPTEYVPYDFDNFYDIYKASIVDFQIGIYSEGFTTIGVQALYDYEGEATRSAIVTLNIETWEVTVTEPGTTGMKEIENSLDVVETEYYDFNGLRVAHPEKGIYVKRSVLSDGSVKISKEYVR